MFIIAFYTSLKDNVKGKLSKDKCLRQLNEFITKAIKIDNRIYERRFEKTKSQLRQTTSILKKRPY